MTVGDYVRDLLLEQVRGFYWLSWGCMSLGNKQLAPSTYCSCCAEAAELLLLCLCSVCALLDVLFAGCEQGLRHAMALPEGCRRVEQR